MLSIEKLSLSFGAHKLFDEVTLNLKPKNRYGLVGANGSGKSSFIKIVTAVEQASSGKISWPNSHKIGWMHQDHFKHEHERTLDVVIQGKKELWAAMEEKEGLLQKKELKEEECYRLGELEEVIANNDGYMAETFAHELLVGLGVDQKDHLKPLSILSGGYKLRVLLAQSLFGQPDILLLDEPTNHLDILSINWLEGYLREKYKGLLVFVTHDHDFLNNLATHILDVDYQDIRLYTGNYHDFQKKKILVEEQKLTEKKSAEDKIAHMKSYVDRFGAKASKAKQAQSRLKMIKRIEVVDIEKSTRRAPYLIFSSPEKGPKHVLSVKNISKNFEAKQVLSHVTFNMERGEKLAVLGPNGVGKSTLLKIISGHLAQDSGEFQWSENTNFSYFSQDLHEVVHGPQPMLSWLMDEVLTISEHQARSILARMLFTKDTVEKHVDVLSGGELCRLVLAKIIMQQRNVLILDEPTNHLDLESRDALAKALKAYSGTVIFVSHDRRFVGTIANRILSLTPGRASNFKGSFREYLQKEGEDYLSR